MSFLNPVNEPVLRFKSTDAGAPQINYNSRVAGDVKAVLKACLVTGYGAIGGAGWSIVNEVGNIAEFVSPSAAMSDYRLAINDNSTSFTLWNYYYQDALITPTKNSVTKNFSFMDKSSADNGWQLLVTDRGLFFIEILVNPYNSKRMARVTNWGAIKSSLIANTGANIGFWQTGVASSATFPNDFYDKTSTETHYNINGVKSVSFSASNINKLSVPNSSYGLENIDLTSELYLYSASLTIGKQVGLFVKTVAQEVDLFGIYDESLNGRPVLKVCVGRNDARADFLVPYCSVMYLQLDSWEY